MIKELIQTTPVSALMSSPVICVSENDEFHVVWEKMEMYDIRHVPVVNAQGVLVGIVSQRSLYKIHSPRKLEDGSWYYERDVLDEFILRNVMTRDPFTLRPDQPLLEAMKAVTQFKFGSIPIVSKDNVPIGIVTRNNIIRFFLQHA